VLPSQCILHEAVYFLFLKRVLNNHFAVDVLLRNELSKFPQFGMGSKHGLVCDDKN
jgi:hypothetical protein